ncbi:MAG: hypothetical protein HGA82_00365, partial [Anaerolineales bacterium]|nr:hypothetical protein [Anaerolineales bacterium]
GERPALATGAVHLPPEGAVGTRDLDHDSRVGADEGRMQVALIILAVSLFFFAIVSTVENLNKFTLISFIIFGYVAGATGVTLGISYWKPSLAGELPGEASE